MFYNRLFVSLLTILTFSALNSSQVASQTDPSKQNDRLFRLAAQNAERANEQFVRCRRLVDGWLAHADPTTGLIPRNLSGDRDIWNARDSAADNYPYMVLTASFTDRELFAGRMLDMLRTETQLTSRVDRLPDTWSFTKQAFDTEDPDFASIIFGSSEYVKDGLMPLTEWLGNSPWSERMIGIVDDIWKHAPLETSFGKIPSENVEINGEMLQVLSRLYWMTGNKQYLDYAIRLGDYYLLGDNHPTRDFEILKLRDHGCEITSGLAELYVTVHYVKPEKKASYHEPIHEMFDRILAAARNPHGMLYNKFNPQTGEVQEPICDTWGYNYNGIYSVYLIDGTEAYLQSVRKALSNLNDHYLDFDWGSADEFADSIEGAINLFNREPIASTAEWIDSEIHDMWRGQREDGVLEGWHGDGNSARTAIMYALWKSQGLQIQPWREDVKCGAVRQGNTIYVSLTTEKPYSGKLLCDRPRHREVMHLPLDYPRINQFPEWYTVEADKRYSVQQAPSWEEEVFSGKQLLSGLPLEMKAGEELRLTIKSADE